MLQTNADNQTRALSGSVSIHAPGLVKASDYGARSFVGIIFDANTTISAITPVENYVIAGTEGHTFAPGYMPWQFTEINITGSATLIFGA